MQLAILGPVEARDDTRVLPVTGARLRRLLVRLAVDAGRTVSPAELVDAVWGDDPPAEVPNALQSLVSRLRRALGDSGLVQQGAGGYRLAVEPPDVDVHRFAQLVADGRRTLAAGDAEGAARDLREALGLWRGAPLQDADDAEYAVGLAARWEQQRLDALADRIDADLALGRAADVVAELEQLVDTHPLRERFTGQLMTALAASGRPAEALAVFERLRSFLAEELGTDPSPALRQQHVELLRTGADGTSPRPTRRSNLRTELSSFVGRDDEVKRVDELVSTGRLTTIVGPGGAGKTRLACRIASTWVDRMADGVWLVELAPVTDAVDIAPTILGSLGLRESQVLERRPERRTRDAMERLLDALVDATCLLVIDNCEHLVDGVASVVDTLLARCPGLRVLTTSREPLGISGESLCVLRSLELPDPGSAAADALRHEAVQLFADRAAAVRADFVVDDSTVGDVVEIVRRLDGLPLAIELAAARLRVLPVSEVAARLGDRFTLLTGGSRTALPRHRTLRAVVQWSWDLLSPAERAVAERLAVFPSGATPASAAAVCSDAPLPPDELPVLLDALVDKSLLQLTDGPGLRYRMLETIREFGLEQLAARGEVHSARAAHARYFADLTARADPHLRQSDQLEWLTLLEAERDNVLGALRFLGDTGDAEAAVELALALTWYWTLLGSHSEAATWLRFALEVAGPVPHRRRVMAHAALTISSMAGEPSELDAADVRSVMADLDAEVSGVDLGDEPLAVLLRPILAIFSGDAELVERRMAEAMACDDPWVSAAAHVMAANIAENAGDVETMRREATAALQEFSAVGDRWGLAGTFSSLGLVRMLDGDLEGAADAYRQAAHHLEELGAVGDTGMIKLRLAGVLVRLGRFDEARRTFDEAADQPGRGAGDDTLLLIGELSVAMAMEDEVAARVAARRLSERLDDARPRRGMGHLQAMGLAVLADDQLRRGDVDGAHLRLVESYALGLGTHDMPILATIGVTVAFLARARGLTRQAAVVLGAAAQLRGADDLTDPRVRALRDELGDVLGDQLHVAYAEGRQLPRPAALERIDPERLGGSAAT